jgi:hypothetical protein
MLRLFFNPYPGKAADCEAGKRSLLATATACSELFKKNKQVKVNDPEGDDSIKCFTLAEGKQGIPYRPSDFIRKYSGREQALITRFFLLFANGSRLKNDDLSICEDWVLSGFEFAAPILEYALRQDGMAITISDDNDWKIDFFSFIGQPNKLPNIHGQKKLSPLQDWIKKWNQRNLSFKSSLEQNFDILFCKGARNACFPSGSEQKGISDALNRAKESGYEITGDLIKVFKTKYGNIRELRSYGDGVRIFFVLNKNSRPVIGGFYRKSASISQNKAGEYAAKRLNNQGYLS